MPAKLSSFLLGVFILVAVPSYQLKLPPYIKTCRQNDPRLNECVVKNGRLAIPKFLNGDTKYRVPRLDPLEISELKVHQGSKHLGLTMALKDCKVTGLKHAQFLTARTDFKNKHIEWDFFHPFITIIGRYEMSGQVLVLPIRGKGTSNITLTNMKTFFKFDYELEKREDGEEYMKVTKTSLDTNIGKAHFKFNNLFNGDRLLDLTKRPHMSNTFSTFGLAEGERELVSGFYVEYSRGETMNRFLNDNWKEVVKELGAPVVDSVSQVFEIILSRITELVPFNLVYLPN